MFGEQVTVWSREPGRPQWLSLALWQNDREKWRDCCARRSWTHKVQRYCIYRSAGTGCHTTIQQLINVEIFGFCLFVIFFFRMMQQRSQDGIRQATLQSYSMHLKHTGHRDREIHPPFRRQNNICLKVLGDCYYYYHKKYLMIDDFRWVIMLKCDSLMLHTIRLKKHTSLLYVTFVSLKIFHVAKIN